jgi:MoaA/NifB/PqqE/SkfB family radical SAM enzyme
MKPLHLELTNRCTLECPACPRTTWKDILKRPIKKADLNINQFEKFIDCDGGKEIDKFILCGDYGDSIYYPNLVEFIQRFRTRQFEIHTNGSYRDKNFWVELASNLSTQDTVVFAIDGLQDTNHLYRKNSDWDSIMLGIDIISKSPARLKWKTIVFSFNYDKIEQIKEFAHSKGAEFEVIKTHRYGDNTLIPPEQLIDQQFLFKKEFIDNEPIEIRPRCVDEKVITCDGYFLPCDWIRNPMTFFKSDLWKQRNIWYDKMFIDNINYDEGMKLITQWSNVVYQKGLEGSPNLDVLCKMKCRAGCVHNNSIEI